MNRALIFTALFLSVAGIALVPISTCYAEQDYKSKILELTRIWYDQAEKTPFALKGYYRVQTLEGYLITNGDPVMENGDYINLPFRYFQNGKGAVYEKFSFAETRLNINERSIHEVELWKSKKGVMRKRSDRDYFEMITRLNMRPRPLDMVVISVSFAPRDALALDWYDGNEKYSKDILNGFTKDVTRSNVSILEGNLIMEWVRHWGDYVPTWKGYYSKSRYEFDLSKQGVLKKSVTQFISDDPESGPDPANSNVTELSDYQKVNGFWFPFKARHKIVYSENEERQDLSPKVPLKTVPGINFEMIIEEEIEVGSDERFTLKLKPGTKIYDDIKRKYVVFGHSPEEMLKTLSKDVEKGTNE